MAATEGRGRQAAWHITDYENLFFAESKNGGDIQSVQYSKRPICAASEWSVLYLQRVAALRTGLAIRDYYVTLGVFELLLDESQQYRGSMIGLRGYVLDEQLRPAGAARIAERTGLEKKEIEKILKCLERVGMLEKKPMPAVPTGGGDRPEKADKPAASRTAGPRKKSTAGRGKKTAGGRKKAETGARVEPGEPMFTALQEAESESEIESKRKNKTIEFEKENQAQGRGKGPVQTESEGQGQPKSNPNPKGKANGNRNGKPQAEAAQAPEPAQYPNLTGPTQSDAGAGQGKDGGHGAGSGSIRLADYLDELYSPEAFAAAVYAGLGFVRADGLRARQEARALAAAWERAMDAGLGPGWLKRLWDKSVAEAGQLYHKRRRCKNVAAVWMATFNRRLAAARAEAARASPVAGAG
jgi:hypothetical protein